MKDIKGGLHLWFTNVLIKSPQTAVLICMQITKLNKITVLETWLHINKLKNLYKSIIKKILKSIAYSGFKHNIWGADLADKQLIKKVNK